MLEQRSLVEVMGEGHGHLPTSDKQPRVSSACSHSTAALFALAEPCMSRDGCVMMIDLICPL
jgi:hypothetical protein